MKEVATLCVQKAHYAAEQLASLPGFSLVYSGPFFKEFLIQCPSDPVALNKKLLEAGVLGGLPLPGNQMLVCVTEQRSKSEIDKLVECLR